MRISRIIIDTAYKYKPILVKIIPLKLIRKIKRKIVIGQIYKMKNDIEPYDRSFYKNGINLIGSIRGDSGLGQSCRLVADIINNSGMDFTVYNYYTSDRRSMTNDSCDYMIHDELPYNINLVHINAHEFLSAYLKLGKEVWSKRYNIAYWLWELEEFPDEWQPCIDLVDEIWTPAEFISNTIRKITDKPVRTLPYSINAPTDDRYDRAYFGLPENRFLFLMMYDSESISERKNPAGVIDAFKLAFKPDDDGVGLIIKINSFKPEDVRSLKKMLDNYGNVYFITDTLSKKEVNSLIKCADVYVSLHRAEGFGLVMAEAMFVGTPVIATDWSANTEFMNPDIACMVDYELVELDRDYGPFKKGNRWAEPDINQAAGYMHRLYEDREFAEELSIRAGEHIRKYLGMDKSVTILCNNIREVYKNEK